jgi:hypothetical protein
MFRLVILIALAGFWAAGAQAQQIPPLATIPPNIAAVQPALVSARDDLQKQRNGLRDEVMMLNADCSAVDTRNEEKIKKCTHEKWDLQGALNKHIGKSTAFNLVVAHEVATHNVNRAPLDIRVIAALDALAKRWNWSAEKLTHLDQALNDLSGYHFDCASVGWTDDCNVYRANVWRSITARAGDAALAQEAAQGEGPGFNWASSGQQTALRDCTIFALANATGRPYGWVAAQAAEIIRNNEARDATDRANPQSAIETYGVMAGEVVMLAEALGEAKVIESADFARTLREGSRILLGVRGPHEVVLSRSFQHNNQTWYEMVESYQEPTKRLYLSAAELDAVRLGNGVAWHAEPGRTPQLLR